MSSLLGIDLGGTKIAATRFDASSWKALASERMGTQAGKPFEDVTKNILVVIDKLKTPDTIGIGIGVPGLIKRPEGTILVLPNIPGAEGYPLEEKLRETTGLPVNVDNDSSCFTLAEALRGAGKGHNVVVGVTMGTGVGGGIVINGKLFQGNHGFSAEIGHMLLRPGKPPSETKDKRGDIEQFLSGTALGKRCPKATKPEEYLEGPVCADLHRNVIEEVAQMCASLTHCIDPSIIVFGGSAGRALRPHLKDIEKELTKWVYPGTPLPRLSIGTLENAGTLGAAMVAME
ncbi:MAG: ROK family protein [Candidatus Peribacteraceae bacterium]|nr:ROK family protein [Candidatus Peribacteraceae bacterium]MDD5075116.1 ROK family protein [Candidatus Peribacteraceae bacterium]